MTRCVHDVDLGVVVVNGSILGEDRDATLFFKIVGIHDSLRNRFVGAESAGLAQHRVHQRGLAVVDVCNDCNVPDGLRGDC